jgi:hypothetical protein
VSHKQNRPARVGSGQPGKRESIPRIPPNNQRRECFHSQRISGRCPRCLRWVAGLHIFDGGFSCPVCCPFDGPGSIA